MKYLLPLVLCLLLTATIPAHAQDDGGEPAATQEEQPAPDTTADAAAPDVESEAAPEPPQNRAEQMRELADKYQDQLSGEMPTTEEMKALADKYNIQPPSGDEVRNFASQHQGQVDKALDYAKQFQEFRRQQQQDGQTGSMAPE